MHGDVQRLRVAVDRLTEKVDGMVDVMSDVEKTICMFLIANWDKFQNYPGPPPAFPFPPLPVKPKAAVGVGPSPTLATCEGYHFAPR